MTIREDFANQFEDTVRVLIIVAKVFIVAVCIYYSGKALTFILRETQCECVPEDVLAFFDKYLGAGTYLVVGLKDLIEYAFKK